MLTSRVSGSPVKPPVGPGRSTYSDAPAVWAMASTPGSAMQPATPGRFGHVHAGDGERARLYPVQHVLGGGVIGDPHQLRPRLHADPTRIREPRRQHGRGGIGIALGGLAERVDPQHLAGERPWIGAARVAGGDEQRPVDVDDERAGVVRGTARDAGEDGLGGFSADDADDAVVRRGGDVGVEELVLVVAGGEHETGEPAAARRVDRHGGQQFGVATLLHLEHPAGGAFADDRGVGFGQRRHRTDRFEAGGHDLRIGIGALHRGRGCTAALRSVRGGAGRGGPVRVRDGRRTAQLTLVLDLLLPLARAVVRERRASRDEERQRHGGDRASQSARRMRGPIRERCPGACIGFGGSCDAAGSIPGLYRGGRPTLRGACLGAASRAPHVPVARCPTRTSVGPAR